MFHLTVIAKEPVPGAVKTRLCPPLDPRDAAALAAAALDDTFEAVAHVCAERSDVRPVALVAGAARRLGTGGLQRGHPAR